MEAGSQSCAEELKMGSEAGSTGWGWERASDSMVGAVVVIWNSASWIEGILRLLSQASVKGFVKIVFVDTGSTDDTVARIRASAPPSVEILEIANCGYAAGLNAGIRAFGADPPPFLLLLNPDLEAEPGFLDRMLEAIARHPSENIGIAGPTILEPTAGGGWGTPNTKKRNLWGWPYRRQPPGSELVWRDSLMGACHLVRREVIDRVGLYPEEYFLYWEEVDYCTRVRKAGFRLAEIPSARIWHHPGEVRDFAHQKLATMWFYYWRNTCLYGKKTYGPCLGVLFVLVRSPILLRDAIRCLLAGELRPVYQALAGLRMGLRGRSGPAEVATAIDLAAGGAFRKESTR